MAPEPVCVLEAQGISKAYEKKSVLSEVSMKLFAGEVFGFLGPNGAGKSTLMRIMMGLEKSDKGAVFFFGENFNWEVREKIGLVPQDDFLYPQFTVRENLFFFGLLNNVVGKRLRKRVDFLLNWLNLESYQHTPVELLSGGYRKLVNIACSIVHDPPLVFMDEPTVALDPLMRALIWNKIEEMRHQKKTVCLTTHYLDEAEALCDRIAILYKGTIRVDDTPENLIERYGGKEIIRLRLEGFSEEVLLQLRHEFPDYTIELWRGEEVSIVVPKKGSFDAMGKIGDFLRKKNWRVNSSTIKQPGIEEVFLAVTKEEKT